MLSGPDFAKVVAACGAKACAQKDAAAAKHGHVRIVDGARSFEIDFVDGQGVNRSADDIAAIAGALLAQKP
jgi:hypothetical protein